MKNKELVDRFCDLDNPSRLGQKSEKELMLKIQDAWVKKFSNYLNYGQILLMLRGKKPYKTMGDIDKQTTFILEQIADMPTDLKSPLARLGHILTRPGRYKK